MQLTNLGALALAISLPASASTLEIRLNWEEVRTVLAHASVRPRVRVRTTDLPDRAIRARLTGITGKGLTLWRGREQVAVLREDVASVRVFPARTHIRRNRAIAVILAVPIGIGAYVGTIVLAAVSTGGIPEGGYKIGPSLGFIAAGAAVPLLVYRKARNMDRGSILIAVARGKGQER